MITLNDAEFERLRDFMLGNYGIDLSKKRVLMQGRLTASLQQQGFADFSEYIDAVLQDTSGVQVQNMLDKLTTNLTFFMREPEHFRFLNQKALPEFQQNRTIQEVRVWSAGCSSGEEPYTLAMTLLEYCKNTNTPMQIKILATDISQTMLKTAYNGIYSEQAIEDLPPEWIRQYFVKLADGNYQVVEQIRKLITFRSFNLMEPFQFAKPFEIIFCRNVMIYFEKHKKEQLIKKFHTWTAQSGYFFVSHSENIGQNAAGYTMVQPSIFQK